METLRLFRKYYIPAGVSMDWLKSIAPIIKKANLLQSGGDLISAKSGIIMYLAGELDRRTCSTPAPIRDMPIKRSPRELGCDIVCGAKRPATGIRDGGGRPR